MFRRKNAFTLIEILVASVVLATFMTVSYKLYSGVSLSFQKGSWSLNAQNKLRNALTFIREEMQKASFPTKITMSGVLGTDAGFELKYKDGTTKPTATAVTLATWHICLPVVTYDKTSDGADYQCELKLKGGNLVYSKKLTPGGGTDSKHIEHGYSNYVFLRNVSKVEMSSKPFDIDKISPGKVVVIKITVRHPDHINFPYTHVVSETGAKVELTVKKL